MPEVIGLVEFDLSSWTHLILIGLFYALWAVSFFQKLGPAPFPPVSCSYPEPCQAHSVAFTIFLRDNQDSWPLGEKCCIISNLSRYSGLHLPCFLQRVQQQHLSVNPIGWVTGTQCLLEVHLLVASLQGQLGFQR